MLRRLAERLTRDWTLHRHLPQDFGSVPILVTPSAGLRYLSRSMDAVDPVLLRLVKELVEAESVVWDIGANVGLFAFAAASLAGPRGQVVAMEPDAWLLQLLRRSADAAFQLGPDHDRAGGCRLGAVSPHALPGGVPQGRLITLRNLVLSRPADSGKSRPLWR